MARESGSTNREGEGDRPDAERGMQASARRQPSPWMPSEATGPFTFMRRFAEEIDRIFDEFVGPSWPSGAPAMSPALGRRGERGGRGEWMPQLEAYEEGNDLVVCADLPGLRAEDIQLDIENGQLHICGERSQQREGREGGRYRSERHYGRFDRTVTLPEGVDEQKAQASFRDGVLEVRLPMTQAGSSRRRIPIAGAAPGATSVGTGGASGGAGAGAGNEPSPGASGGAGTDDIAGAGTGTPPGAPFPGPGTSR